MALNLLPLERLLPTPGPVWGPYPMRAGDDAAPARRGLRGMAPMAYCRRIAHASQAPARQWLAAAPAERMAALAQVRAALRQHGLQGAPMARALGIAAAASQLSLNLAPRETQLIAACALLDNRLAEMATGEGKTLAIGLAAAVAALAGIPVHVVTANDYLARRDALQLAPLFAALGLQAATLADTPGEAERRVAYTQPIVYGTAKELAFDYLRDRQALGHQHPLEYAAAGIGHAAPSAAPLMRGLCMALLDEADSILLDEAEVPLILSRAVPHAARRAFLWQALALARQLVVARDFTVDPVDPLVQLLPEGERRLEHLADGLGGPWRRPRYRRDAVRTALAALHVYQRDTHYVVRDAAIELLDEVTGRVAPGRVWSRGLHTVVALKEGLTPAPETETVAQTTFQRFFQRYWRMCGISGTLWEARAELHGVYGARVLRIPLHRANRRIQLAQRRFADPQQLFDAAAARAAQLQAAGRPVLIGTDAVSDSHRLSQCLQTAGIAHQVLNALNDAQEAAIVAQAGHSGRITVATRMAGRGTDIEPDAHALAAGGLHVLSIQHNPSQRLDRQLAGRAARHGDPGSCEHWLLDTRAGGSAWTALVGLGTWNRIATLPGGAWLARLPAAWKQHQEERRRMLQRRYLLEQDRQWEKRLAFAGRAP